MLEPIQKISFHFHPYGFENKTHTITKDENGKKRKYLVGISSGIDLDAHGERMSESCVKSFLDQSNKGDILLFPDVHGIQESADIGILTKAEITPNNEWMTTYRLYDEGDNIGAVKLEKINDIWKQINGLPPYQKPRQKGFSIEGIIPDKNGVIYNSMGNKVINEVMLDGVCLVPRPAYKESIANAVYKALGELPVWTKQEIKKSMDNKLEKLLISKDTQNQYYSKKMDIEEALDESVKEIMSDNKPQKDQRLDVLFDEFKQIMIKIIIDSSSVFQNEEIEPEAKAINKDERLVKLIKAFNDNNQKIIKQLRGVQ